MRDTAAAKALLYRRAKSLSEFDNAKKALEKARSKNKDVSNVSHFSSYLQPRRVVIRTEVFSRFCIKAEAAQQKASDKYESISDEAKKGRSFERSYVFFYFYFNYDVSFL